MKTLITASVVKAKAQEGARTIPYVKKDFIITPEAFEVAKELGIQLLEQTDTSAIAASPKAFSCGIRPNLFPLHDGIGVSTVSDGLPAGYIQQVRHAVIAQLPTGSFPEALLDQIILKVIQEQKNAPAAPPTQKEAIHCVDGKTVQLSSFPGHNPVGIADIITGTGGFTMAAGIMAWTNYAFPWTLNYDEVDYIIEGELHLRCNGTLTIARAGDVVSIPKGTTLEFATPSNVKFFYVTYPANWQDQ